MGKLFFCRLVLVFGLINISASVLPSNKLNEQLVVYSHADVTVGQVAVSFYWRTGNSERRRLAHEYFHEPLDPAGQKNGAVRPKNRRASDLRPTGCPSPLAITARHAKNRVACLDDGGFDAPLNAPAI
jgi:hypothetical protein